jgi:hypothetical protein
MKKRLIVMSPSRHITKPERKSREWFELKVAELGEALNRLPPDRKERFELEVVVPPIDPDAGGGD